ncbi:chemotaxis protein CheA [Shewanella maritima]|uniref:chemotaxis protein CheA n=1 Tax=Shewanella maritima TaxID=2520507 RepID=UPI001A90E002|nr:chemotaxis protein CheA [Shewanella maritima]
MDIDLSQFSQVFFEESLEGLDIMESELLEINIDNLNHESINTIFRAAHSIKGGSATFGFNQVANFTHLLETLLDDIRDGKRQLSALHVDMLLQSVDILRAMIDALMNDSEYQSEQLQSLSAQFEQQLAQQPTSEQSEQLLEANTQESEAQETNTQETSTEEKAQLDAADTQATLWQIRFVPGVDILRCGNDPSYMFTELQQLGKYHIKLNDVSYPGFDDFDPEVCSLQWTITLLTDSPLDRLKEVFEWVEDECQLDYLTLERNPEQEATWFSQQPSQTAEANNNDQATEQLDLGATETSNANTDGIAEFDFSQAVAEAFNFDDEITSSLNDAIEPSAPIKEPSAKLSKPSAQQEQASTAPANNSLLAEVADLTVIQAIDADNPTQATSTNDGAAKQTSTATKQAVTKTSESSSTIRVGINKVDQLINMVGELIITQAMLGQIGQQETIDDDMMLDLRMGLEQLSNHTRELQESVMKIRMLPISFAFNRFPRLIHDISKQLGKKVDLVFNGEETELDKTVMEKIVDPLVHLVRNALDHGIEMPEVRRAQGKSEMGTISLNAYHRGGAIIIEIIDDGAGLNTKKIRAIAEQKQLISASDNLADDEINQLIFHPGFTTADEVSDLSGRGVGMDVVKRNITDLNGTINLQSQSGQGCKITINLPLTLAILDGQLVRIGEHIYVVPLVAIHESLQVTANQVNQLGNNQEVIHLREEFIPLVRIYQQFNHAPDAKQPQDGIVMIVDNNDKKVGLLVDELLSQQQVVIKNLEDNYTKIAGVSGATILGDGTVALIIDVNSLAQLAGIGVNKDHAA